MIRVDSHEVVEREKDFFDRHWSRTGAREIQGSLFIPGVENLRGKRVLICSCGSGEEPVRAAKAGAEVFTFDISPVAIEKAMEVARFNEVRISAEVMDFHDLRYPGNFFDLAYGRCILHHVDCYLAGLQLRRCLKPGGIAAFWENSDRNPVIRWIRRKAFGQPGGNQRLRFWFLKRHGTPDEYPLTDDEIAVLSEIFDGNVKILYGGFAFFQLLGIHVWGNAVFRRFTALLDNGMINLFPGLWKYSFWQWIVLQKPLQKA